MMRGVEGFGAQTPAAQRHLADPVRGSARGRLAVDTRPRIEAIVDQVTAIPTIGLITLERARLLRDGVGRVALPADLTEATRLTVYLGRQDRVGRVPAFVAVCDLLRRRGHRRGDRAARGRRHGARASGTRAVLRPQRRRPGDGPGRRRRSAGRRGARGIRTAAGAAAADPGTGPDLQAGRRAAGPAAAAARHGRARACGSGRR